MAGFVESLTKQHLWNWLEKEQDYSVYSEITIGNGRIDLVGTKSNERIGVELKSNVPKYPTKYYSQISRYIASGEFDKVYFASHDAERFRDRLDDMKISYPSLRDAARHLNGGIESRRYSKGDVLETLDEEFSSEFLTDENASMSGFGEKSPKEYISCRLGASTSYEPVSMQRGIELVRHAKVPKNVGVIKVPLGDLYIPETPLTENSSEAHRIEKPGSALVPGGPEAPEILKEAKKLEKSSNKNLYCKRNREQYIKHNVWTELTGIPEGSIPNIKESDQGHRPIDLLSFKQGTDPVDILRSGQGEIVGVETKGIESFDIPNAQIANQLKQYAESGGLSRLYLAVPRSLAESAQSLVEKSQLRNLVGIMTVNKSGNTSTISQAPTLDLRYDSYLHKGNVYRIGYDDLKLPDSNSPNSAYIHSEELARLRSRWQEKKQKEISSIEGAVEFIRENVLQLVTYSWPVYNGSLPTQSCVDESIVSNTKIRSYLVAKNGSLSRSDNTILTKRLTLHSIDCEAHTDTIIIDFDTSGSGGKLWIADEQIDYLINVLGSISEIMSAELNTYDSECNEYVLEISSPTRVEGGKIKLRSVILTPAQWKDLLVTISSYRENTGFTLLEARASYPRIGPEGDDTWDHGTEVEGYIDRNELSDDISWPKI